MPVPLVYHILVFAGLLPFRVATAPSLNIGSLPQAAVAATTSLELNGNFTLPPFPPATTLHNASNDRFPPNYIIPETAPILILKINPSRHNPLQSDVITYLVIRGLEALVRYPGDSPIPARGMLFMWHNAAVSVRSHLPGALDLTYKTNAALLRGVWEISEICGPAELDMEVYIGRQDEAHYRGHVALFSITNSKKAA